MGGKIFRGFNKMKKIKKCPICGSKEMKFLFEGRDKLLRVPGRFNLFKCENCKAVFLNPQPSDKELEKHYANDKYYSLKGIDNSTVKLRFKLFLYNVYFNKKVKKPLLKILFQPFKFIVRGAEISKGKKLLDVGSRTGQFLYEMKCLGLDGHGLEPGDFNEQEAKKNGLKVKKGFLKKGVYKKESFDIITINHVLEHVRNPSEIVEEAKNLLKKNGLLIIGVPNTNSLSNKIFRRNWLAYDVPRHLINYSEKNLSEFLKKHGFKVKKVRYNSRPNQFVVGFYFTFDVKKRRGIRNRILEAIFIPLTLLVNSLRIGDQIEIWCTK
jgi:2-polyprenyl-3-methyl-5-hydroxy-6-metoxy-1,4-benzoquinol methylase